MLLFQTHASPTSPSVRLPTSPSPQQIQSGHHQGIFSPSQLPLQLQMVKTENKSWPPQVAPPYSVSIHKRVFSLGISHALASQYANGYIVIYIPYLFPNYHNVPYFWYFHILFIYFQNIIACDIFDIFNENKCEWILQLLLTVLFCR